MEKSDQIVLFTQCLQMTLKKMATLEMTQNVNRYLKLK